MRFEVTEHVVRRPGHATFHLACGPEDGVPVIFVHGWPELAISWRHQLPVFAALGLRAVAPDMRGYGRSTIHPRLKDYALEAVVDDMLDLLDSLGHRQALWVGHDWGAPVVWSLASHHPDRCLGVANLCVPYLPDGFTPDNLVSHVDRSLYPADRFPYGQWDYQYFYREHFDAAVSAFEADVAATVSLLFRRGEPRHVAHPSPTAFVRGQGGWFGGAGRAPTIPLDTGVLTPADHLAYTASLQRNGFFGPDAWYMNGERNADYARRSGNGRRLTMPVLFLHARFDSTCLTLGSSLAQPMREHCQDLTEVVVDSGHWMAQEQPVAVNRALAAFIGARLPRLLGGS